MDLISRDEALSELIKQKECGELTARGAIRTIKQIPVVELIRCKECVHWKYINSHQLSHQCNIFMWNSKEDSYCSLAARKDEQDDSI